MQITEALIEKFFTGRCSREEAASLSRYFRKHPEVWRKYVVDSWDSQTQEEAQLPLGYKELMLKEIGRKTFGDPLAVDRHKPVRVMVRWVAAAACIAFVIGSIWMLAPKNGKNGSPLPALASETAGLSSNQTTRAWQETTNHTDQKLKMKLEDGSIVTLFPRSSIRYERHFSENRRDLYLQGQAFFQAAKDRRRPLTVYAGNMATTVLGTSFNVNENETGVVVKLYSGKVMIRPAGNIVKGWKKDVFLLPGEEMRYESGQTQAEVASFRDEAPLERTDVAKAGVDDGDLSFDNTALPDVMNKLSKHYRIHIDFHKTELTNMYFSGSVLKTDSLSVILKVIANMNDLAITQTNDGFKVRPSKK